MIPVMQCLRCESQNSTKELNNQLKNEVRAVKKFRAVSCEKCIVLIVRAEQLYLWALIG